MVSIRSLGLAAALFFFSIPLIFDFPGLSDTGHRMLAIFFVAIILWVTEAIPLFATAALIIILEILMISDQSLRSLPIDYVAQSYRSYFAVLADPVLMLLLGGFFLAMGTSKFRLDRALASSLLKPFGNRPTQIMLGLMLITGCSSMFMSNTATTATMMAVVLPVVAGLAIDDRLRTGLVLSIPIAANIGGIGTPVGTPPNAIAIGQLSANGIPISFGRWMVMAVPGALILLLVAWWLLARLFPTRTESITLNLEARFDQSRSALIFYGVFAGTVILWLTETIHGVSSSVVGFLPVVLLLSTRIFNEKDLQNVQWPILWLVAGGIALGRGVTDSGLDVWLVDLITWQNLGPTMIASIFTVLAIALSTVMSNSATTNLLVPIAISLAQLDSMTLDPLALSFLIAIGASLAIALPISTPPNAIAYSSGLVQTWDMAKAGLILGVLGLIWFLVISPVFWSLIGLS